MDSSFNSTSCAGATCAWFEVVRSSHSDLPILAFHAKHDLVSAPSYNRVDSNGKIVEQKENIDDPQGRHVLAPQVPPAPQALRAKQASQASEFPTGLAAQPLTAALQSPSYRGQQCSATGN